MKKYIGECFCGSVEVGVQGEPAVMAIYVIAKSVEVGLQHL